MTNGVDAAGDVILKLHQVAMRFGGVDALDGVSCAIAPGIIHAVIGPNGAGKTTLFNCISGLLRPTGGAIELDGRRVDGLPPHRVARLGISRTFQHVALFSHMTVLENVMLGRHLRSHAGFWAAGLRFPGMRREERRIQTRALEQLDFVGLADSGALPAGALPLGQQKILEIARALATEPRLLLLDEPAGGLNMKETEQLGELIQRVCRLGTTVLLVEHDMNLVMEISDQILVLHYGQRLALGTPREIKDNPAVIEAYLGE
jgi:branched-chain amino acid transport system ATP-binding protein